MKTMNKTLLKLLAGASSTVLTIAGITVGTGIANPNTADIAAETAVSPKIDADEVIADVAETADEIIVVINDEQNSDLEPGNRGQTIDFEKPTVTDETTSEVVSTTDVTSNKERTKETVKEQTEKAIEQPAENILEQPAENVAEQPAENVAEQPAENVAEQPAENVAEQPAENVAEQPADNVGTQPSVNVAEQPADNVGTQPSVNVGEQPADNVGAQPSVNVGEQPADNVGAQPSVNVGGQPADDVDEQAYNACGGRGPVTGHSESRLVFEIPADEEPVDDDCVIAHRYCVCGASFEFRKISGIDGSWTDHVKEHVARGESVRWTDK